MRPVDICSQLNAFLTKCMADGVVEAFEFHRCEQHGDRQYLGPVTKQIMIGSGGPTFSEFISVLDQNSYSAVFADTAILSMQSVFEGNEIKAHRYLYVPCPINPKLIEGRPNEITLADWLRDADAVGLKENFRSSGALRFDYTSTPPAEAADPHPASHLTLGADCCRIPVKSPLSPSGFLEFVFENFYRGYQDRWRAFAPHLNCAGLEPTITGAEAAKHHVFWT